ncbi:glycine-rich domain-containing protein-like [Massilia sp. R2A-15]|uniref:glycine-rich domain-containing protein n=1 Tax=Massilia sp. R2A-15 TaxID=3064278 RepID=UPI00273742ED|nr:glycine-rich domain-containing protein-like [Massilia sp. R2A-15]WLI90069.1 glycine-rich domain-containing protein-like [Massilia sp. R2A-15]
MNSTAQFNVIAALDLASIKTKLMNPESGEGWSRDRVDAAEFEYRRFLYLAKLYPHESAAPLCDVDIFWHHHILDTMKYAADCEQVFGYFLHHLPDNGQRGEVDAALHDRCSGRMHDLYAATFGVECGRQHNDGPAIAANAAWCQLGIKKKPQAAAAIGMQMAWCQLGIEKKSQGAAATGAQVAWCQLGSPVKADGVNAQTAWCQLLTPVTARMAAQNHRLYSPVPEVAAAA